MKGSFAIDTQMPIVIFLDTLYAYWVYMCHTRDPFSALNFRSGAHNFHKFFNIPLRSITILQFLPFRRILVLKFRCPRPVYSAELCELAPEPHIFTLELPELAPEPSIFTLVLDPEPPIFHLAAAHTCTYQNLG